jgi:hypothetical protein
MLELGELGRAGRPTVRVQLSRADLPMENPDWWDVSAYLRGPLTISRGRQQELGIMQCGTATLVLDNRSRIFDPGVSGRMPMQRVRISALISEDDLPVAERMFGTVGDLGDGYWAQFTGFVESWEPDTYDQGARDAVVYVRAVDGFEPLARMTLNQSFDEQTSAERVSDVLEACGWGTGESWVVGSALNGQVGSMVVGPVGDRALSHGITVVPAQTLEQEVALQHLLAVAEAEGGSFFFSKAGLATFHNRHRLLSEAGRKPMAIFGPYRTPEDEAPAYPYTNLQYGLGCEWIYNEVRTRAIDGQEQVSTDSGSILRYFRRTLQKSNLLLTNDIDARAMADWLLYLYHEPRIRFDEMVFEGAIPAGTFEALLALDIGDLVEVRLVPPGEGDPLAQHSVIQGISHRITEVDWQVTWRLAPQAGGLMSEFWLVGVSELGSDTVLAW